MNLRPDRMRAIKRPASQRGARYKAELSVMLRSVCGADAVVEEHRFHEVRRWRFDFAVPALKLAVEYDGHGATGGAGHVGGHGSLSGMAGDAEKFNTAQAEGWRVLRFCALHFRLRDRNKHKLTSPLEMIEAAVRMISGTQTSPDNQE